VTFEQFVQGVEECFGKNNPRRVAILTRGEVSTNAAKNPYFSYTGTNSLADLKHRIKANL